jgi:predicted nucleic acid-binding protein
VTIFLDTSSLFKLYVPEIGSEELYQLFDHLSIERVYLSEITIVEFRSTVWRKVRMKEITVDEAIYY